MTTRTLGFVARSGMDSSGGFCNIRKRLPSCATGYGQKATSRTPDGKMPGESCRSPREVQNYLNRISGPLLDRIDIHVEVPAMKFREITAERTGETSAQIRDHVFTARRRQQEGQISHRRHNENG